jgi:hypothetical protein
MFYAVHSLYSYTTIYARAYDDDDGLCSSQLATVHLPSFVFGTLEAIKINMFLADC